MSKSNINPTKAEALSTVSPHDLPLVLRDQVPIYDIKGNPVIPPTDENVDCLFQGSHARAEYQMKTPRGDVITVTVPQPGLAHMWNLKENRFSTSPQSDDWLFNCTAYALGTWNPKDRTGYIIDINEGVWRVLNDPGCAEVIMKPQKVLQGPKQRSAESLTKIPQNYDIFVVWEKQAKNGIHECCHAAKLAGRDLTADDRLDKLVKCYNEQGAVGTVQQPSLVPVWKRPDDLYDVDYENTFVGTKNGLNRLQVMKLGDMLNMKNSEVAPGQTAEPYRDKLCAIYRLKQPTQLWPLNKCRCIQCYEARKEGRVR